MARTKTAAVAYLRTSSAANVGPDKDSERRQRAAIEAYARSAGIEVVDWYYDAAVSGAKDPVDKRPGFAAMLARIEGNGVRTIIVESPDRFARDLAVQISGHDFLKGRGIDLIPTTAPDYFLTDTPTAQLVRNVLGAIAEFEKAMLVAKLKGARDRKRATGAKVEGRPSHAEARPDAVALAKRLHRASPKTGRRMSLRSIAARLAEAGHVNAKGAPFSAQSIANMVAGPSP